QRQRNRDAQPGRAQVLGRGLREAIKLLVARELAVRVVARQQAHAALRKGAAVAQVDVQHGIEPDEALKVGIRARVVGAGALLAQVLAELAVVGVARGVVLVGRPHPQHA
nr:hypothetical protein [Tanacetum cinerariifolium]